MATQALTKLPRIGPSDRLGLTVFFAVVLHAILILGITFSPEIAKLPEDTRPPLEITLVHQRSDERPEHADYLAQANLDGGGTTEEERRPRSPASTPVTPAKPGPATVIALAAAPPPREAPAQAVPLTQPEADTAIEAREAPPTREEPLTAAELVARSLEIAHLSAEISQSMEAYAQRKKHRYIASRAREFRDAAYLDAWRAKVERIGNLNYPEEAKQRKLSGSLILDVALNPDGSIYDIALRRSSGQKILDDAAVRIVKLAAPFAEFPAELRKDTDVLHITRTWQFLDGNRISAAQ